MSKKRRLKKKAAWIDNIEREIIEHGNHFYYTITDTYGDAKFDLKESKIIVDSKYICKDVITLRYEYYDYYGSKYGQNIQGAEKWIKEKGLIAPEKYLEKLLTQNQKYHSFDKDYTFFIECQLNNPPANFKNLLEKIYFYAFLFIGIAQLFTVFMLMQELMGEKTKDYLGNIHSEYGTPEFLYFGLGSLVFFIYFYILKKFQYGRLHWHNNTHALTLIFLPIGIYLIIGISVYTIF
ncbi:MULTISPECIES: hypothetical protein [unclassified Lysinibacillus]|uniref:hypothetical protein n=1 Tax=unclassified Lysinibacillus TaxID=2636778 RepID=UPI00372D5FEE